MATLTLYQFATSPFCAKVRKILDFKGLDYRAIEVDYLERKELLIASNQVMVPALTLESGETIVDSDRIAIQLDGIYPEPTIFPPEWRGIHLALGRYFDGEFEDVERGSGISICHQCHGAQCLFVHVEVLMLNRSTKDGDDVVIR